MHDRVAVINEDKTEKENEKIKTNNFKDANIVNNERNIKNYEVDPQKLYYDEKRDVYCADDVTLIPVQNLYQLSRGLFSNKKDTNGNSERINTTHKFD